MDGGRNRCPEPLRRASGVGASVRWVLLFLVLVLPAYGLFGALTQVVGANHQHRPTERSADVAHVLYDLRRAAPVPRAVTVSHHHAFWQRHHHARGDATVVALDAETAQSGTVEGSGSLAGSASLCTPASCSLSAGERAVSTTAWPRPGPSVVTTLSVQPAERPPKAA